MIRAHFGLAKSPFSATDLTLLPERREVLETLRVHCQQGGLCVIVGEPGTGKSAIKHALCQHDPKRLMTPVVNRTLHTYHSTLRILCEAFQIETDGADFRCEARLIDEARRLNGAGKMLAPIIDDAHLMEVQALRRIRLLFEDFPKNHCLVVVAQPECAPVVFHCGLPWSPPSWSRMTAGEPCWSACTYRTAWSVMLPACWMLRRCAARRGRSCSASGLRATGSRPDAAPKRAARGRGPDGRVLPAVG